MTKLEELKIKERSYNSLGDHMVGTGIYSYETSIKLPMDSPNHGSPPIDSKWFREAIKLNWSAILKSIKLIAEADIARLRAEAAIEAGEFLKETNERIKLN